MRTVCGLGDCNCLASETDRELLAVDATAAIGVRVAKGVTMFDSRLHFRKDFYKATPLGRTAAETEPDSKAAAELRAAYAEAKRLSGYTTKPVSEAA